MGDMDHTIEGRESLIVAFVDDLMSATRIEAVGNHLGYRVKTLGRTEALISDTLADVPERPGEPIDGPMAALVDTLTAWQPALLIFDMANRSIPWRDWLAVLKSSPATRRLPVICYGPHVDKVALADAAGMVAEADAVVPRSKFFSAMPELIGDTSRADDYEAIERECDRPLSANALRGLEAFNEARYFEAHEHLEDAWNADPGAARELYRAVLQVAVAYLQIERGNYRGAIKMFLRARQWLAPLPDRCRSIDVARLRRDAESVHQSLAALGPDQVDRFDLASLPPVRYGAGASGSN
jgi:predicted metal-dependent hydrolase